MEVTLEQKIIIVMLFDGWVKFTDNFIGYENPDTLESLTEKGLSRKIQFDHKFYHNSYDYLMPVWVKFRRLSDVRQMNESDQHYYFKLKKDILSVMEGCDTPESLFHVIYKAISWLQSDRCEYYKTIQSLSERHNMPVSKIKRFFNGTSKLTPPSTQA